MPIIEVEIVRDSTNAQRPGLAASMADAIAPIFGKSPERTWVKLDYIEPGHYAEGDGGPLPGVQPMFVTVLLAKLPGLDLRQNLAAQLAEVVGDLADWPPENVHVIFEPEASGRVAFGGKLVL